MPRPRPPRRRPTPLNAPWDVLDRVPPSRLRATARTRRGRLDGLLAARPAESVADLRERLHTLPPPVDASGAASACRAGHPADRTWTS
ncbi:hypothetical protein [Streptomyces sp. NBC_00829]|uniref:hypothetical protein n=1 Tax=Streptomyces sp. NBC_00829 TaxID=2903679 RepID=UPI00386A6926|nr:hypothetical protein OG293_25230 [Streptomyces sp. NBC_00829]